MEINARTILIGVATPLVAGLIGCASPSSTADRTSPAADTAGASPAEHNPKEARWLAATRGLTFANGRVLVDAEPRVNRRQAESDLAEGLEAFNERNDFVGAIGHYRDALQHWPECVEAYQALGDALAVEGKQEFAIAAYQTGLDLDPDDDEAMYRLAMTRWAAGEREAAIVDMQHAAQLRPERADTHVRLAIWHYYSNSYADAWAAVHAARARGGEVPAQFIPLLEAKMPDPGE